MAIDEKNPWLDDLIDDPEIEAKLEKIKVQKYIHNVTNKRLWRLFRRLMAQVDPEHPIPKAMGCMVIGESHSGKTTGCQQFRQARLDNVEGAREQDAVYFPIPVRAQLKGVLYMLGHHLKIPDLPIDGKPNFNRFPTYALIRKISTKLINDGTKLLMLDEVQNLFALSHEQKAEILGGFNEMINLSHVPIVLVGTNGIDKILDVEDYEDRTNLRKTFRTRFMEYHFEPWMKGIPEKNASSEEIEYVFDPDFISFFHTVCTECNVPTITDPEDLNKIIEMTEGLTGKIIFLIHWAAVSWIDAREKEVFSIKTIERALSEISIIGWWGERTKKRPNHG